MKKPTPKARQAKSKPDLYQAFYEVIERIPFGRVATYGQIASLAGFPRHARHVGYSLAALPEDNTVPWHRVINARGEVSLRREGHAQHYQRFLLEEEGVEFNQNQRVNMAAVRWEPGEPLGD